MYDILLPNFDIKKHIHAQQEYILALYKPKMGLEPKTSTSLVWEENNIPCIQDQAGMFKTGDQH
jgi:hypothetical protein